MRIVFIILLTLLIGVYLPSDLYGQELLDIENINRQPYFKFELKETPIDILTFYLSEFNRDNTLLIIYVQALPGSSTGRINLLPRPVI